MARIRLSSDGPAGAAWASGCWLTSGVSDIAHLAAWSERGEQVEQLLAPRRLLYLREAAASAVRNAGLRNLFVGDHVLGGNIARPHDALHGQHPDLEVHAHFLRPADHQIAVGQHTRDDRSHQQLDAFRARDGALALARALGVD